ncbi:MAG: ribosome maturation factor RimM [Gammaproteobacteria bacterium]|nr:ribosome maturation factor RimM [Gammaproteobacteria bacterium]
MSTSGTGRRVRLGRITGLYGVKGWVKVHSYTEPRENIVEYATWVLEHEGQERRVEVEAGRRQGRTVVAKLRGLDDRDEARAWLGADIAVDRDALPPCEPGEYYWVDLEGLEVRNTRGEVLGEVDHLMATGANDVIVLRGPEERMVPFVQGDVVVEVDLERGVIVVDWESSFWDR